MFGIGMPELLLILAVALIVIGPKKLPDLARSLGRGMAEFKKATREFKQNLDIDTDIKETGTTLKEVQKDIHDAFNAPPTSPPETKDPEKDRKENPTEKKNAEGAPHNGRK